MLREINMRILIGIISSSIITAIVTTLIINNQDKIKEKITPIYYIEYQIWYGKARKAWYTHPPKKRLEIGIAFTNVKRWWSDCFPPNTNLNGMERGIHILKKDKNGAVDRYSVALYRKICRSNTVNWHTKYDDMKLYLTNAVISPKTDFNCDVLSKTATIPLNFLNVHPDDLEGKLIYLSDVRLWKRHIGGGSTISRMITMYSFPHYASPNPTGKLEVGRIWE